MSSWNIATIVVDVISVIVCLVLLFKFRKPSFLLWPLRSLAAVDILFHLAQAVKNIIIFSNFDPDNWEGCMVFNVVDGVFFISRHISVLQETHIALCCVCCCLRRSTALRILQRFIPVVWILGACFGLPETFMNRFVYFSDDGVCGSISYQASLVTFWVLIVSFVVCACTYVCTLVQSYSQSPQSVQRRELRRLAIYPLNFLVTYGMLMVIYGSTNVPFVGWNIAFFLESFNGILNVYTYTTDLWHRQARTVAFDEGLVSMAQLSASGDPVVSEASQGVVVGTRVQLQDDAIGMGYGPLVAGAVGEIVQCDAIRDQLVLVSDLQSVSKGWYFRGDIKVVGAAAPVI